MSNKLWALTSIALATVITVGGLTAWSRYSQGSPIEITMPPAPRLEGQIYVGGAVNSPGLYPLSDTDRLSDLLRAAGGASDNADQAQLKIYIPAKGERVSPQKVDINRADKWLLEALPGIGEVRAQAIVSYRQLHGPFKSINDLSRVDGIGPDTLIKLAPLITVAD